MNSLKTVEEYLLKSGKWQSALILLRDILNSTEMNETIKWGAPCYTVQNKNVVGLAGFKNHACLWFHQGVFLKDQHQKLVNAQEGTTKALRQWRFNSLEEIQRDAAIILKYLEEAIANQKAGKTIKSTRKKPLQVPDILLEAFNINKGLKESFSAFTASKQREFVEYLNEAKRVETKQKRLSKIIPMMFDGIGLMDKYRK